MNISIIAFAVMAIVTIVFLTSMVFQESNRKTTQFSNFDSQKAQDQAQAEAAHASLVEHPFLQEDHPPASTI